jgi:Ni/Co efflux regulator RcnB
MPAIGPALEADMNRKRVNWIAVAALALSGVAAAHDGGRGWDRDGRRDGWRAVPEYHDGYRVAPGYGDRYRGYAPGRSEWRAPAYAPSYGYRPSYGYGARDWHRGDRFPAAYGRPFPSSEYARYGLYAPPRGYQWVQTGDDFLLTALATGIILDVLTHLH